MTNDAMVRIYARENATQRGGNSQALLGSVVGAIRLIAQEMFVNKAAEISAASWAEKHGIGYRQIMEKLGEGHDRQQIENGLALLKQSGDYRSAKSAFADIVAAESFTGSLPALVTRKRNRESGVCQEIRRCVFTDTAGVSSTLRHLELHRLELFVSQRVYAHQHITPIKVEPPAVSACAGVALEPRGRRWTTRALRDA